MVALIVCLAALATTKHFPVAVNHRTELVKVRFVVLKKGELLGFAHTTLKAAGLAHVVSADHGLTPQRFNSPYGGCTGDVCCICML